MKILMQTESLKMLKETVKSDSAGVRFGPEFCEWKIPSYDAVEEAYSLANEARKEFTYVTPRVSDLKIKEIRCHLKLLDQKGEIRVVVNDMGILKVLREYPNLKPQLGRQMISAPARCPWKDITQEGVNLLARKKIAGIFYQTSLNHMETVQFFRSNNVLQADVDWIPRSFQHYHSIVKKGLDLSVHWNLVPVTITRRCHMARFLGETTPDNCTKPCDSSTLLLRNEELDVKLFLLGNVVFRLTELTQKDAKKLDKAKVKELIVSMNPLTGIDNRKKIDAITRKLVSWQL